MKVFCLFEQSGTFKNAFKEFGFEAYDCDILDDFKQTDFKIDLFAEIEREFEKIKIWQEFKLDKKVCYSEFAENKGDYFKKPTNFWFFNFEPQNNFIWLNEGAKGRRLNMNGGKAGERHKDKNELLRWFEKEHELKIDNIQKARSMISSEFARNFIKMFVLNADEFERIS